MFMFKVRAFEDILKRRGKQATLLQQRNYNYPTEFVN
jgi:hypothetical protein